MSGKCDTCGWLRDVTHPDHAKHYSLCGWVPSDPLPSNVLHDEVANISGWRVHREYLRWIPKRQLDTNGDAARYLRLCPAWKARP